MEEILASIRRIIEDSDAGRGPADTAAEPDTSDFTDELAVIDEANDGFHVEIGNQNIAGAEAPSALAAGTALRTAVRNEPPAPPISEPVEHHAASETTSAVPDLAAATSASGEDAAELQRPAIISDRAGRQVAAAFEELSDAFAASRRRSFDEMAEEMLRPMLQDWLDNNLPVLVERLVREEIERVARGAGR